MTPAQLAVLADALRSALPESDAADVLRWATHPEAVRELLSHTPMQEHIREERRWCRDCAAQITEARSAQSLPHLRTCRIAAAWRALGDPRGAADVERAHEEALREQERRCAPRPLGLRPNGTIATDRPAHSLRDQRLAGHVVALTALGGLGGVVEATMGPAPEDDMQRAFAAIAREGRPWMPIAQIAGEVQRTINRHIERACERILGHRLSAHDQGALALRQERSTSGLMHITVLRDEVEQVTISAALLGDRCDITEHWNPTLWAAPIARRLT